MSLLDLCQLKGTTQKASPTSTEEQTFLWSVSTQEHLLHQVQPQVKPAPYLVSKTHQQQMPREQNKNKHKARFFHKILPTFGNGSRTSRIPVSLYIQWCWMHYRSQPTKFQVLFEPM